MPSITDFLGLYGEHDWYVLPDRQFPLCMACAYNYYQVRMLTGPIVPQMFGYNAADIEPEKSITCTGCGLIVVLVVQEDEPVYRGVE